MILAVFNFTAGDVFAQSTRDEISDPMIDVTAGVGFMWVFQFNTTISPLKHIFIQPRISIIPLLAYDVGGNIGYQIRYEQNMILRFGVGYSQGEAIPFYVTGDITARAEKWRTVHLRVGILRKFGKHAVFNPNINITRMETRPIFSFNITLGYAFFR